MFTKVYLKMRDFTMYHFLVESKPHEWMDLLIGKEWIYWWMDLLIYWIVTRQKKRKKVFK